MRVIRSSGRAIAAVGALLLVLWSSPSLVASRSPCEYRLSGVVVAFDVSPLRLLQYSSIPNSETLVVHLDPEDSERLGSDYIRIVYQYWSSEPRLPDDLRNSRGRWEFQVKRADYCDSRLHDILYLEGTDEAGDRVQVPGLKSTSPSESLEISEDYILPCFVLRPGGYRQISARKVR
jgi:hypothetical protein